MTEMLLQLLLCRKINPKEKGFCPDELSHAGQFGLQLDEAHHGGSTQLSRRGAQKEVESLRIHPDRHPSAVASMSIQTFDTHCHWLQRSCAFARRLLEDLRPHTETSPEFCLLGALVKHLVYGH